MWATKRKGSGKKKSTSDSKRRTKSSEDELHDFIHDIEYSAKKILKQHMKRKVKEAAREKNDGTKKPYKSKQNEITVTWGYEYHGYV